MKKKTKLIFGAIVCAAFLVSYIVPCIQHKSLTEKHKAEFVGRHSRSWLVGRVDETIILEYSETHAKVYYVAYNYAGLVCDFEWDGEYRNDWDMKGIGEVIWHSTAKLELSGPSQNKIIWPYFYHNWFVNRIKKDIRNPVQEEFQIEMVEILQDTSLYLWPKHGLDLQYHIVEEIDEGVIIFPEKLKMYLHTYKLENPDENPPSYEEFISLYNNYHEDVYVRFARFRSWFGMRNGRLACDEYSNAIYSIMRQYKESVDENFKGKTYRSELTLDEMLELEEYAKQNPDFENTDLEYIQLLKWLGVEIPEDSEAAE